MLLLIRVFMPATMSGLVQVIRFAITATFLTTYLKIMASMQSGLWQCCLFCWLAGAGVKEWKGLTESPRVGDDELREW